MVVSQLIVDPQRKIRRREMMFNAYVQRGISNRFRKRPGIGNFSSAVGDALGLTHCGSRFSARGDCHRCTARADSHWRTGLTRASECVALAISKEAENDRRNREYESCAHNWHAPPGQDL